jgi:hypothetical protein
MADNATVPLAAGTAVATDDVSGVLYQRVKLVDGTLDSSAAIAGDATYGLDVDVTRMAALAAGEAQIGNVGAPDTVVTITASLDTSAYADGDVLFDTQEIASAVRVNGHTCILQSVVVSDISDQGQPFDLIFFNANTSLGTENAAPDIDDTEVLTVIGRVQVTTVDYYDLGGNRVACVTGIGLPLKAGAATTSLYVAGVSRGTGTYGATALQIQFGFLRN